MSTFHSLLLLFFLILVLLPLHTVAFGAGDIPDFAYLNNRAFRHGDIENVLQNIAKVATTVGGGGGLLGFASTVLKGATGGKKFSRSDIKHVYFGNWLRDYSQAMDIAGLSKLSADTLVLVVSVLGFMTFGYATAEYEVTADRLGVYLPVEHIDNPKGYAEKEGDARQFHPKLRPPVHPEELEIDERTGMKKYMATEGRSWDTSTAHIRRTFAVCIEHGRRARGHEGADLWEAYRLMGTGLHTMEDLLAHSNWCEIALRKLGHSEVFCHVGENVVIRTPNGSSPPLVTGTFGSADFIHSLMGEATDHISEASVVDLSAKMEEAKNSDGGSIDMIKNILGKIPFGGSSNKVEQAEDIKRKAYHFNPDDYAPEQVQQQFMQILRWRDSTLRDISEKIEKIPGLENLLDQLTNALNAYVYSLLAPWLAPILEQATGVLGEGSKAVIDSDDQYEVFNNPNASDPSHSLLSKDHFGLILNEPAGKIAQVVVEHSVNLIVTAWFDDRRDINQIIDQILEAFHHPYYATGRSQIQGQMMQCLQQWLQEVESPDEIIQSLTKESVREGRNKRQGSEEELAQPEVGYGSAGAGYQNNRQEYGAEESYGFQPSGGGGGREYSEQQPSYRSNVQGYGEESYGNDAYGRRDETSRFGEQETRGTEYNEYGNQQNDGYRYRSDGGYENEPRSDRYGADSYESQVNYRTQESGYNENTRYENEPREDYEREGGYEQYGSGRGEEREEEYREEEAGGETYGVERLNVNEEEEERNYEY